MGAIKKLFLLSALLAGLSYWLYEPIPDGYSTSSAIKLRVNLAVLKIVGELGKVGHTFGYDSVQVTKSVFAFLGPYTNIDATGDPSKIKITDAVFDSVPVRIYEPVSNSKVGGASQRSGLVYYHGGGWVIGSLDMYQTLMIELSTSTNVVFVSVDYRLAPQWLYPIAHEDCVAATKYFLSHAHEYGVNPERVAIGGDSAGGNLAASVALKLRDEGFKPQVKLQLLIYPVTQIFDFTLPSMLQNSEGPLLTRMSMANYAAIYVTGDVTLGKTFGENGHVVKSVADKLSTTYLNVKNLPSKYLKGYVRPTAEKGEAKNSLWAEIKDKMMSPYLNPLVAPNVEGLPMTFIFTCEHDVLRDEALLYGHRLKEAGNKVTYHHMDNGFHGILSFGLAWPETEPVAKAITSFIRNNL